MSIGIRALLLVILSMYLAGATADDGVVEINHSCATISGCFSGDDPDYPVTIDGSAGSRYQLTGNLVIPDADTDGIRVGAPGISIDLNGFQISSPSCLAEPGIGCRPESGSGQGVGLDPKNGASAVSGELRNGTIMGMGTNGVDLGSGVTVENLRVLWNGGNGISIASGMVRNCQAIQNGVNGILATGFSLIIENLSNYNTLRGIDVEASSTVKGNQTWANDDDGVRAAMGSTIEQNSSGTNGGDGFEIMSGSLVQHNNAYSNTNLGFRLTGDTPYSDNAAQFNSDGGVMGGTNRGGNYCEGDSVVSEDCP